MVQRALDVGCKKMMITGSNLQESKNAVDLAKQYRTSKDWDADDGNTDRN